MRLIDKYTAPSPLESTDTPNCDRLGTQGVELSESCDEYINPRLVPVNESHTDLLRRFLGIDPKALERERRVLLAASRRVPGDAG